MYNKVQIGPKRTKKLLKYPKSPEGTKKVQQGLKRSKKVQRDPKGPKNKKVHKGQKRPKSVK